MVRTASDPPPLPPTSNHPYAIQEASSSRSAALSRAAGRLSAVGAFRKAGSARASTPPPHPPPDEGLPPLPTQSAPPNQPSPSTPNHSRNASASSSRHSNRFYASASPPASPNPSGPTISPRSSSLFTPAQVTPAAGVSVLDAPIELRSSPGTGSRSRAPRTPSRQLLQTALDLAQRAVEMDKNNDVLGALAAYREAVARLKKVMERVGVEPNLDETKRRRSTVGKADEEGRTLRGIVSLSILTSRRSAEIYSATRMCHVYSCSRPMKIPTTYFPPRRSPLNIPPSPRPLWFQAARRDRMCQNSDLKNLHLALRSTIPVSWE